MTVYDIAARLPPIDVLRDRCKALAVLECIFGGGEPYYAYTRAWGDDEAELMDNGSGDEWAVVFTSAGAFIRVFNHESAMTPYRDLDHELWPGPLDGIPTVFRPQIEEPAFSDEDGQFIATAVLWRRHDDDRWRAGENITFPPSAGPYDDTAPDGSGLLEILFDDIVDRYVTFAEDYYEIEVDPTAVEHVVAHRPLTDVVVQALNPEVTIAGLHEDITAIGYPITAA
ncbi:hypothetical protein KBX03_02945 [Micromonospora sp. C72]|uniref:hypothetical protein n=1 Tax=Micromonospora sp. C72 TaxID=2824880 RepID=UPI001B3884FB|nr:hypothetical protein [Micromonospora sp. C72]MBQ1041457.1 hypothetical protein [Micromonospora sp. C72]